MVGEDSRTTPREDEPSEHAGEREEQNIRDRLTRLEVKMESVATREDIAELKVLISNKEATMQRWLLGILASAVVAIAVALIRTLQ